MGPQGSIRLLFRAGLAVPKRTVTLVRGETDRRKDSPYRCRHGAVPIGSGAKQALLRIDKKTPPHGRGLSSWREVSVQPAARGGKTRNPCGEQQQRPGFRGGI